MEAGAQQMPMVPGAAWLAWPTTERKVFFFIFCVLLAMNNLVDVSAGFKSQMHFCSSSSNKKIMRGNFLIGGYIIKTQ